VLVKKVFSPRVIYSTAVPIHRCLQVRIRLSSRLNTAPLTAPLKLVMCAKADPTARSRPRAGACPKFLKCKNRLSCNSDFSFRDQFQLQIISDNSDKWRVLLFAESHRRISLGHLPGALEIYLPGPALSMVIVTLFLFLGIWFFTGRRRLLRM
jgi:hypothetical protein